MIAADAFLAMFIVQILAMSVLYPSWFIRYSRRQATRIPAQRLAGNAVTGRVGSSNLLVCD